MHPVSIIRQLYEAASLGAVGFLKHPSNRIIAAKFDPQYEEIHHNDLSGGDRDDFKWRYFKGTVFWWEGSPPSTAGKEAVDKWLAARRLPVSRHTTMVNWFKYTKS